MTIYFADLRNIYMLFLRIFSYENNVQKKCNSFNKKEEEYTLGRGGIIIIC